MAQTHVSLLVHIVFSTKNRANLISPEIELELFAYIGGIIRNHIHLLISLGKRIQLPDLVGHIKRNSTKWIKTKGAMLAKFGWQDGYSAFSVGHPQVDTVKRYIADQKVHHEQRLFEEEMRGFYRKYGIEFDERYVWD